MWNLSGVECTLNTNTININANNTLDINDIIAYETKVVSLFATQDTVLKVAA